MLVVTRRADEAIVIGSGENAIVVTITELRGDKVRIGLTALDHIGMMRSEVYDAVHGPGATAALVASIDAAKANRR